MKDSKLEALLKADPASASDDFALSDPEVDIVSDLEALDEPTPEEIEEWARIDKEEDSHSMLKEGDSPVVVSGPPSSTENDISRAKPADPPTEHQHNKPTDTVSSVKAEVSTQRSSVDNSSVATEPQVPASQTPQTAPTQSVEAVVNKPYPPEIEEFMPLLSSTQQNPSKEQGWGWNAGWNFSAIGGKLKQVAAEAVKDVAEIKDSLSHLLSEDDKRRDSEDEEQEVYVPPSTAPAAVDSTKRQPGLERSQGPDPQLEVGLQAIDDQVEQLASGAAKALGSLWGGIAVAARTGWSATQNIANKVEAATLELAKELVQTVEDELVKPAHSGIKSATGTVSKLLEEVGRGRSNTTYGSVPPGVDLEATFAGCFHQYGGQQSYEELEALSNECARICNKTRTRLDDDARADVDDALTKLAPLFSLGEGEDKGKAPAPDPTSAASVQLQREYAPVGELQSSAVEAAERLRLWATKRLAAIIAELDAAAPPAASEAAQQRPQEQQQQQKPHEEQTPAAEGSPTPHQEQPSAELRLSRVSGLFTALRAAASQQLAELCSTEIQLLLRLGRSISAPARYGRPSDDGIRWPETATMKAALLRLHALRMVQDLKTTTTTFTELLTGAGLDVAAALKNEAASVSAEVLASDMEVDCSTAASHVREGFRNLMYIVLLSALPNQHAAETA